MSRPSTSSGAPEQNPLSGGCPVAHHGAASTAAAAASPAALPVGHPSVPHNKLAAGCPIAHGPPGTVVGAHEPRAVDAPHSAAAGSTKHPFQLRQQSDLSAQLPADGEEVPSNSIPAAGRGNSDDGKEWLNPSANQLFRALARKEKPIEPTDANAVAAVHVAVTDNTWSCIMEYEKLHAESEKHIHTQHTRTPRSCVWSCDASHSDRSIRHSTAGRGESLTLPPSTPLTTRSTFLQTCCSEFLFPFMFRSCPKPTLARFQGMDGIYSIKAKIMMNLWYVVDTHTTHTTSTHTHTST